MLKRLQAFDWASTEAGPYDEWPETLKGLARTVVTASAPMTLLVGPTGLVVYNDAVRAMFGSVYDGPIGKPVAEVLPEAAAFYRRVIAHCYKGASPSFRNELLKLRRQGRVETAAFNLDFTPVLDAEGRCLGVLLASHETTESLAAERALRRSEERLNLALGVSGMVGIWDMDLPTRRLAVDERFARLFGIDPQQAATGLDQSVFLSAIHDDDRARVEQDLEHAALSGEEFRSQYRVVGGGYQRWVSASGRPVLGASGKLERFPGVVVDVTEQVETTAALAESEFRFQTLTETLPHIVWSCDADGRHDYFSHRWFEFTGLPAGPVPPDAWEHLVHPDDWPRVQSRWAEALRTGATYDLEYRFRHRSGQYRWLHVTALPFRNAQDRIARWCGTAEDIEDAKHSSIERELVAQELAHRIKNIFALFAGLLRLSLREHPELQPLAAPLEERVQALSRAHAFVQGSSSGAGSLQLLLARLLAPYSTDDGRVAMTGDDVLLNESATTPLALIFHELTTNALKYGGLHHEGGNIRIALTHQDADLHVDWKETSAVPPAVRATAGFGSKLLRTAVESQLRGQLTHSWEPTGLRVELRLPISELTAG
jgi:PAS domain S-box-containing protein